MTTGKFDKEGNEIFVGDKVIKPWGFFSYNGQFFNNYKIHTITEIDAYQESDGNWREDKDGKVFLLGKCYNNWIGGEVKKITNEEIESISIDEDVLFFFNENNKAVKYTDQHLLGISDEEWEKELEKREKMFWEMILGPDGYNKIFN